MSRHGLKLAMVAAVATLGTLGVATDSAQAHGNRHRLTFEDVTTASTFVDLDHNEAPDPGDYFVFHEEATVGDSVIEYNDSQCVVGFDNNFLCHVVIVIGQRGQVTVDGSVAAPGGAFPGDFDLAVTGGTGEFAGARGYAHVHRVSETVSQDSLYLRG